MPTDSINVPMAADTPPRDLRFLRWFSLKGPNIWTYRPVVEVWVDIGALEDFPSNILPGFSDRLVNWLPGLIEHHCSVGQRGGFIQRLQQGTWSAHILEHVALELQTLAGMPAGFGRAREMEQRGVYKVVVRAYHETVTRRAIEIARILILSAINDVAFDVAAAVNELVELAETHLLGPSTHSIVDAADDRHIPSIRLNQGNLVQLGYGSAQRRIWTAETDQTSAIAETISRDKALTKQLLQQCGIPVPEGIMVHSAGEAWQAAQNLGVPVVVKPLSGNHGRAVFVNLTRQHEIETAWRIASEEDDEVMVEQHISGQEHRLLIVGGKLIAAARGDIATVCGDGHHTIRALIDSQINTDPRRGDSEAHPLNLIRVDSACTLELQRQGYSGDDVPQAGQTIIVQRIGNVSLDVTEQVHPDTAATVALAARVVGLDIAGIDLVVEDISRPLAEQKGALVEVNAGPGLLMHLKPSLGLPRPVGPAIVDHLFPHNCQGRIPLIAVYGGSPGRTTVARLVAYLLQLSHPNIGLASQQGLFVDQRQLRSGDCANWDSVHQLLLNPIVSSVVLEISVLDLLTHGLAFDRCQIAVITDIDHQQDLSEFAINSPARQFMLHRTLIDLVLPQGAAILNAHDPLTPELMPLCDGDLILFANTPNLPIMNQHLQQNGRAVWLDDTNIIMSTGAQSLILLPVSQLSQHLLSPIHLLAAIATAWALGFDFDLISTGLLAYNDNQG